MAEAKEAQEPSMEEILASIRRIISDEDAAPEEKPTEAAAEEPEDDASEEEMDQDDLDALFDTASEDVEPVEEEAPAEEPEPEPDPEPEEDMIVEGFSEEEADISFAEEEPEDAGFDVDVEEEEDDDGPPLELGPELEVSEPVPMPDSSELAEALLSPATDAAVSSAFGNLAHTILSKNARTLEDLVQEMLRPMLKIWLDDNLPTIVERLVRQEIERVTRGGNQQQ
ncbi:MAG: DUF2497 domain-containing protein [Pseudomonadota bacterium]